MNMSNVATSYIYHRPQGRVLWKIAFVSVVAGFLVVSLGGASIVGPIFPAAPARVLAPDTVATQQLQQLRHLGFLSRLNEEDTEHLLTQLDSGHVNLGRLLARPEWQKRLGFSAQTFKATWYAANPFDLLPIDLQIAIKRSKQPFRTSKDIKLWCKSHNAPARWVDAFNKALVETTAVNLWRASRGKRPYAKNGQYLQPIVVEKTPGVFDMVDGGHIATDPRVIPTNTKLWLLVQVEGQERLIRVKATDIGGAIRGKHVDLPVALKSHATGHEHGFYFPNQHLHNPTVVLFIPKKSS
jgi:hypothetical protein